MSDNGECGDVRRAVRVAGAGPFGVSTGARRARHTGARPATTRVGEG